jgi:hypothetical protein
MKLYGTLSCTSSIVLPHRLVWQTRNDSTGYEPLVRYNPSGLEHELENPCAIVHGPSCLEQGSLNTISAPNAKDLTRRELLAIQKTSPPVERVSL